MKLRFPVFGVFKILLMILGGCLAVAFFCLRALLRTVLRFSRMI